jgi:hypothetical protein
MNFMRSQSAKISYYEFMISLPVKGVMSANLRRHHLCNQQQGELIEKALKAERGTGVSRSHSENPSASAELPKIAIATSTRVAVVKDNVSARSRLEE